MDSSSTGRAGRHPGGLRAGAAVPGAIDPGPMDSGAIASGSTGSSAIEPGSIDPGDMAPGSIASVAMDSGPIGPGALGPDPTASDSHGSDPTASDLHGPDPIAPNPHHGPDARNLIGPGSWVLGFVVGLTAEARIAARAGHPVQAGGGTLAGARDAAEALLARGANALISFGLAGGLDPALRPGTLIVPERVLYQGQCLAADAAIGRWFGGPTRHLLLAPPAIVAEPAEKRGLHTQTGAHAVDLESGAVAQVASRHGVPFAIVRAICDPAERALPPLAQAALNARGQLSPSRMACSLLRQPRQVGALLALAQDAARARRALLGVIARIPGSRVGHAASPRS